MRVAVLALVLVATPALADGRELCPERPGLDTPPCVLDRGKVQVETGLADWTLDKSGGDRTDTILLGDTLVRYGLTDRLELQFSWTPVGWQRARSGPLVDRATRVGDVTLGAKLNLASPDGSGFAVAVRPTVSLPIGGTPIGAGDWGASLLVPLSYDLSDVVQLAATPELDAAVDEDGDGRHAAYGGTVGVNLSLSDAVSTSLELQAIRDRDPAGHSTQALGGLAVAWQTSRNLQLDIGSAVGLNHATSDFELYAGISRRF